MDLIQYLKTHGRREYDPGCFKQNGLHYWQLTPAVTSPSVCSQNPPPVLQWSAVLSSLAFDACSDEVTLEMRACISSSTGLKLERASAMHIFLPGTSLISLKWNLIIPILNVWILDRNWPSLYLGVAPGVWRQFSQRLMYSHDVLQDRSHAHVSAGAFICAHLVYVGVVALDMNETGCRWGLRRKHQLPFLVS